MGKFRYKRLPQGTSISPDVFNLLTDGELRGNDWLMKNMDDISICTRNFQELTERIIYVLQLCERKNIKLSLKKFQAGESVTFGGTEITYNESLESVDLAPEERKIAAIKSKTIPTNRKAVQSLLGMLSQMNANFPDLTKRIKRHRTLLNRTSENWKITPEFEQEFEELKAFLDKKVHLSPIRTGNNLLLYTDASINGLGYVLCQERKIILDGE